MSIEMQDAIIQDNSFEAAESTAAKKVESEQGSGPVDTKFEEKPEATKKTKKKATKKAPPCTDTFLYQCRNKKCGISFDEPKISGTGANQVSICPMCLSKNIDIVEDVKQQTTETGTPKPPFLDKSKD